MNHPLKHPHQDGDECAQVHESLYHIVQHRESVQALRDCLTILTSVAAYRPTYCLRLRYLMAIAHELSFDGATADNLYERVLRDPDYTLSMGKTYETFRYDLLTARGAEANPEEQVYFRARTLKASDAAALLRKFERAEM